MAPCPRRWPRRSPSGDGPRPRRSGAGAVPRLAQRMVTVRNFRTPLRSRRWSQPCLAPIVRAMTTSQSPGPGGLRAALPARRAGARLPLGPRSLALLGISLGYFMVLLDMTVLSVAEPDLASSLHTSISGLQWAVT